MAGNPLSLLKGRFTLILAFSPQGRRDSYVCSSLLSVNKGARLTSGLAVALLPLLAAAAGALFVPADFAGVVLDEQPPLLAGLAGAGGRMVGVPGGSGHVDAPWIVLWVA